MIDWTQISLFFSLASFIMCIALIKEVFYKKRYKKSREFYDKPDAPTRFDELRINKYNNKT